jgi:hypothetical protein
MTKFTLTDWYSKAIYYKGQALERFTFLELTLEERISEYFFNPMDVNKASLSSDMKTIILNRLTFESKRTAFRYLCMQVDIKKGFIKSKNGKGYPHKEILAELRKLIDERNRFAHYSIIQPVDSEGIVIALAELRDRSILHKYTNSDIQKLFNRITKVQSDMIEYSEFYRSAGDTH